MSACMSEFKKMFKFATNLNHKVVSSVFLTNELLRFANFNLKNTHFSITWQPFPFYNVLQIIRYCVLIICKDKYVFLF